MDHLDIREIDREALHDALETASGAEYEELTWYRDILYMIDEGFIDLDTEGRLYKLEECPTCPE